MIRELKIAVSASGKEAQYDEHAKNIAGQKFIIANILAKSVEAFRGMKPKDIIPYIEGEPYINKVPVEPGLTNAAREENYELHRFLGTIFSQKLAVEEKLHIMKTEYDISEEEDFRKDVNEMCNLGEGIMEEGIAIGMEKGIAIGETRGRESGLVQGREEGIAIGETKGISIGESRTIRSMHKNGFTAEQIAAAIDKDLEEVRAVLTDF